MTHIIPFVVISYNLPVVLTSTFSHVTWNSSDIYSFFILLLHNTYFPTNQIKIHFIHTHIRDIRGHPLLNPLPSTSLPSLLLFLLACLEFPLAVRQHGGSIWKCLLKASKGCCSWGPCWSYFYALVHSRIFSCNNKQISMSNKCQTYKM